MPRALATFMLIISLGGALLGISNAQAHLAEGMRIGTQTAAQIMDHIIDSNLWILRHEIRRNGNPKDLMANATIWREKNDLVAGYFARLADRIARGEIEVLRSQDEYLLDLIKARRRIGPLPTGTKPQKILKLDLTDSGVRRHYETHLLGSRSRPALQDRYMQLEQVIETLLEEFGSELPEDTLIAASLRLEELKDIREATQAIEQVRFSADGIAGRFSDLMLGRIGRGRPQDPVAVQTLIQSALGPQHLDDQLLWRPENRGLSPLYEDLEQWHTDRVLKKLRQDPEIQRWIKKMNAFSDDDKPIVRLTEAAIAGGS